MKTLFRLALLMMLTGIGFSATAQTTPASNLINQGIELSKQGKHAEAVSKYQEALQTDPQDPYSNYQMAFSLHALKKGTEAIPYLETAAKSKNASFSVPSYCLLATIYDESNQSQKAIDAYTTAIKINPDYPQIYYNLGLVYSREKRYMEAEDCAIEAIKHNLKNAGNQRLYALVTFHQNKRVNALMGFCSFLLLEPTGARAAEAYGNIQHIMQGGVLKDGDGRTTTALSTNKGTLELNKVITIAVQSAQAKKLAGLPLLEFELKMIFTQTGQLTEKKVTPTFFDKYFAAYFYKLAQSQYMPALAHTVAAMSDRAGDTAWINDNPQQISGLASWITDTNRDF